MIEIFETRQTKSKAKMRTKDEFIFIKSVDQTLRKWFFSLSIMITIVVLNIILYYINFTNNIIME